MFPTICDPDLFPAPEADQQRRNEREKETVKLKWSMLTKGRTEYPGPFVARTQSAIMGNSSLAGGETTALHEPASAALERRGRKAQGTVAHNLAQLKRERHKSLQLLVATPLRLP
ncbi:hypothetical protein [Bradyrhizobium nanningense]|uniref:hypothetical protein n=1 Tax=Bradyrhizobium nanningense TaxID=1325118 RepID=UPI0013E8CCF2|nr:hypothetical protein [Bradyrhizobium nanningense]